jgi:hypothetical protein
MMLASALLLSVLILSCAVGYCMRADIFAERAAEPRRRRPF